MESTSIYNYRIKKHWKVNSGGDKIAIFYPQYKSKLFGWRYIHDYYDNTSSSLVPKDDFAFISTTVLGGIGLSIGFFMFLFGQFVPSLIVLSLVSFVMYLCIFFINKYSDEGLKKYSNVDNAESYIQKRIGRLVKKEQTNQKKEKSVGTLPEDEIIYLDLKVERAEKLKQIKKSRFKFW